MDDVSDVTFELRRRLTLITSECDLLLTEPEKKLAPETRQAIERIDDEALEIAALIARLESTAISETPLHQVENPEQTLDQELPQDASIRLVLPDVPLIRHLITELESQELCIEHITDPVETDGVWKDDATTTTILTPVEALNNPSLTQPAVLSLVTPPESVEPILGVSGILSPNANADVIEDVLDSFYDPTQETGPIAVLTDTAATRSKTGTITTSIKQLGRDVIEVGLDEDVGANVGCTLVFTQDYTQERVARLREIRDGRRRPVVLLDTPPNGLDWQPTIGGRTFVQRPITAPDLAGELLLILND